MPESEEKKVTSESEEKKVTSESEEKKVNSCTEQSVHDFIADRALRSLELFAC